MIQIAIPTTLSLLLTEDRPIPNYLIKEKCVLTCEIIKNVDVDILVDAIQRILNNPKSIIEAVSTAKRYLPRDKSVTFQEIDSAIDKILTSPDFAGLRREEIARNIQENYNIRMDDFRIIEKEESRLPWIKDKKTSIEWKFWDRYRDYLQDEKNYPEAVLSQLDKLTDRTLDGLFNPDQNVIISKYGLVVGQVQSGKTSNYTGLICKAADAGWVFR